MASRVPRKGTSGSRTLNQTTSNRFREEFRKSLITAEGYVRNLWEAVGYQFPPSDYTNATYHRLNPFLLMAKPIDDEFLKCLNALVTSSSEHEDLHLLITLFLDAYGSINGEIESLRSDIELQRQSKPMTTIQISAGYLLYIISELKHHLQVVTEKIDVGVTKYNRSMGAVDHSSIIPQKLSSQLDAKRIFSIDQALNAVLQVSVETLAGCRFQAEDYWEFSSAVLEMLQELEECLAIAKSNASALKTSLVRKDQSSSMLSMLEDLKNPFSVTFCKRVDALSNLPTLLVDSSPTHYYNDQPRAYVPSAENIAGLHPWRFQMLLFQFCRNLGKDYSSIDDDLNLNEQGFCSLVDSYTRNNRNNADLIRELDGVGSKFLYQTEEFGSFVKSFINRVAGDRQKIKEFFGDHTSPNRRDSTDHIPLPTIYQTRK